MTNANDIWRRDMQLVVAEPGGAFQLHIINPKQILTDLVLHTLLGRDDARRLCHAIGQTIVGLDESPKSACANCYKPLIKPKFSVVIALPDPDRPAKADAFALCEDCADLAIALAVLRRRHPGVRFVSISDSPVGCA